MITDLLTKSFDDIIDVEYTRNLEDDLDKIEAGQDRLRQDAHELLQEVQEGSRARRQGDDRSQEGDRDRRSLRQVRHRRCSSGSASSAPSSPAAAIRSARTRASSKRASPNRRSGEEEIEPCENCGKPMAMKRGRFGQFLACTGYPECKTTRKLIATKQGGLRAAKADQILDEKCPRCSVQPRRQAGPLRRVHGVHEVSRVQVHQAQDDRRQVPEGRRQGRRGRRAEVEARQDVLRLLELSRLRLRALEPPDQRAVPEVRRAVPRREDHQEARPPDPLQQRGVRLRALRSVARNA